MKQTTIQREFSALPPELQKKVLDYMEDSTAWVRNLRQSEWEKAS